jgi:hypothetical protein
LRVGAHRRRRHPPFALWPIRITAVVVAGCCLARGGRVAV